MTAFITTPIDIFSATQQYFDDVKADVFLDREVPIVMELRFSKNRLSLLVQSSLDRSDFFESMRELSIKIKFDEICGKLIVPRRIDTNDFDTMMPLSDWQKFRRVMYEKDGRSCVDEIIKFLQYSGNQETLSYLGLAPQQVEANFSESDFNYFKELSKRMQQMIHEEKRSIFKKFRNLYPNIAKRILDELASKSLKQDQNASNLYEETLNKLRRSVLGQEEAIKKLTYKLIVQDRQIRNGAFLFVGPTGVGKTELAKAISQFKQHRFVRFNMNQYALKEYMAQFFGSPSGTVGCNDKPHFVKEFGKYLIQNEENKNSDSRTERVENVVVLFDEMEKAHHEIKQSLLTLFDEGYIDVNFTESTGLFSPGINIKIRYIFTKCILIGTSNLYQDQILDDFNQGLVIEEIADKFVCLNNEFPLPTSFSQEFLRRMIIVPFSSIPREECYQSIIKSKLNPLFAELKYHIRCAQIKVEDDSIYLILENKLYEQGTDIRRIQRYFEEIARVVYANLNKWPNINNKSIVIGHYENNLGIKVFEFLDEIGDYHDTGIFIDLP